MMAVRSHSMFRRTLRFALLALLIGCSSSDQADRDLAETRNGTTLSLGSETSSPIDESYVRLPAVELATLFPDCSDSTLPRFMEREPTIEESAWATNLETEMGWEAGTAIQRGFFVNIIERPLLDPLWHSPRFAGASLGAFEGHRGYIVLKDSEPLSDELTAVVCQHPDLAVRIGADHSMNDLQNALADFLSDERQMGRDNSSIVDSGGVDIAGNGVSFGGDKLDSVLAFALRFEAATGVRVTRPR